MSSEKLYWVGNGSILVTLKNKSKIKLFNGDEIKPEYLTEKEQADGIGPEFVKRHKAAGNISNNPLAGRVQTGSNILQNKVVEQGKEIEDLKKIIARNSGKSEPVDSKKFKEKLAQAENEHNQKVEEIEKAHLEEIEALNAENEKLSDYVKALIAQIEDLDEKPVEPEGDEKENKVFLKRFLVNDNEST